ncbi:uncharacterized protein GIQ15_03299 [Arthroderma uncinatum]|uniref:uncharacterized protein n=1 Tax=Arthroderma uncinatum TaxID=74035 RepID=UPI00144AB725|nr:uncharacterized protein GIQ15_03299 [Arthroderma uncinatum]KAF3483975.1 hypothetical protein GIQ15_03299 [Arthroderma uncinatum]
MFASRHHELLHRDVFFFFFFLLSASPPPRCSPRSLHDASTMHPRSPVSSSLQYPQHGMYESVLRTDQPRPHLPPSGLSLFLLVSAAGTGLALLLLLYFYFYFAVAAAVLLLPLAASISPVSHPPAIMSDKNNVEAVDSVPRRSFGSRIGTICRRFWWLIAIIFVVVALVIILPVIFVAYPKLAQRDVSDSTLAITDMQTSDPTPDSMHVKITQVIGSKSKFHPVLDPFDAQVFLSGEKESFMTLSTPEVKSHDGVKAIVDQDVQIKNHDGFAAFSKAVMLSEHLDLLVIGKTQLKLGGLQKTTVDYNKTVSLKGMNQLKGFNITNIKIQSTPGTMNNMKGDVFIPNPSVLTLAMGNLTLDLSVDGHPIGTSYLNNVIIKPGDNTIPMVANADLGYVLKLTGKTGKYPKGIIPLSILGNSSVANGKELTYYSKALASNKLEVPLNVPAILAGKA